VRDANVPEARLLVADQSRDRLRAVTLSVPRGVEEDVDLGVAPVGLVLLGELDHACQLVTDEDRVAPSGRLVVAREILFERSPPVGDRLRPADRA
jgi:hypothetical protein